MTDPGQESGIESPQSHGVSGVSGRSRILHLADLHLGARHAYAGSAAGARSEEADRALARIVDWVLRPSSPIAAVIIAGDLFDSPFPEPPLAAFALGQLRRLTDAGIRLLTVPGNHDELSYPKSVYRLHEAVWPGRLVVEPAPTLVDSWEIAGTHIDLYAMAFVAGRSNPPYEQFAVRSKDARNIAVFHASLDRSWPDRSIQLTSAALAPLGFDYIALGHIHSASVRRVGQGWACYAGRIEGGGFDDPGGAGLAILDVTRETWKPEREEFAHRRFIQEEWNISSLPSADGLKARIDAFTRSGAISPVDSGLADGSLTEDSLSSSSLTEDSLPSSSQRKSAAAVYGPRGRPDAPIVRLRLTGCPGFAVDTAALAERARGSCFHLEILDQTASGPESLEELAAEPTVRGLFVAEGLRNLRNAPDERRRRLCETAIRQGLAAFSAGERKG